MSGTWHPYLWMRRAGESDEWQQAVAAEFNLSETAFLTPLGAGTTDGPSEVRVLELLHPCMPAPRKGLEACLALAPPSSCGR